jgi:hypothetical protein
MKRIVEYLFDEDDAKIAEKQEAFFHVGGHLAVVRAMKEHPNLRSYKSTALMCS